MKCISKTYDKILIIYVDLFDEESFSFIFEVNQINFIYEYHLKSIADFLKGFSSK